MVSSDNTVYAQLTDVVGPKAIVRTAHDLGIRSRLAPYFSIGLGSVAVNPLELARAYATVANDGLRVDGSHSGTDRASSSGSRGSARARSTERAAPEAGARGGPGGSPHRRPRGRRPLRHGQARRDPRAARSPARPARPTTTPTRGSSATRPSSSSPSGSATRTPPPDAHRVRRRAGHRRHAAGDDLEDVRREGRGRRGRDVRLAAVPRLVLDVRREARRRWQLDNGYCRGARVLAYFSGPAPTRRRTASRTR